MNSARLSARVSRLTIAVFGLFSLTLVLSWAIPDDEDLNRDPLYKHGVDRSVYNRTLGFEKIFVISRPDRTDRRDALTIAASIEGFDFKFFDGVDGSKVPDKAIPTTSDHPRLRDPVIGCWRAHMNVMQEIVRNNIATALILEDDADWDIRLRSQLYNFSIASRSLLCSKHQSDRQYAKFSDTFYTSDSEVNFEDLNWTEYHEGSPYGDGWDLLWVGHSEMNFVPETMNKPKGRIVQVDHTVPESHYLKSVMGPYKDIIQNYPHHTRVTHHAYNGLGTTAYAVSLVGARRVLYQVGLKDLTLPVDNTLRSFCDGTDGRTPHVCVCPQPSLFEQYRPPGPAELWSDIQDYGNDHTVKGFSYNVRRSIQHNLEAILEDTGQIVDQWPDTT